MNQNKNKIFVIVKWIVMLAAYSFLIVKLARIEYWNELKDTFQHVDINRISLLILILVLLPINWWLESVKWQYLMKNSLSLSIRSAVKSVLAGISTGYITPNRVGDFAGRILYLPKECRVTGVVMSVLNSITQNIIITVFGVVGATLFLSENYKDNGFSHFLFWIQLWIFATVLFIVLLPYLSKKLKLGKWSKKINESVQSLSSFRFNDLFRILLISTLRYGVYCIQYFLMLQFFQIEVSVLQALIAIPAMYLFITFTPSLAASEPAIRGSYAVLIFSSFSTNNIGIMLTGIMIWLINFVVPMLLGTVVIGRTKVE